MLNILSLLAISVAPAIYLAIVIYGKDKYDREPKIILLVAFLWGCFSVIPAILLGGLWNSMGFSLSKNFIETAFYAFVAVGLSEELSKFIMLRFHAYRRPEFNEPFDGIVYAAFVSLGFATVENILYVFEYGFGTGVLRMFTSVPGHYAFGVVMGYYVGKAKFNPENRFSLMTTGVLYATLLHGAYDFFIMQENYPGLAIFTLAVFLLAWRLSKKAIREMQTDSKFRFRHRA